MPIPGSRREFSGDYDFTAPTGGYTAGLIYLTTDTYCVARETVSAGAACVMAKKGPVYATKNTGTGKSFARGDKVYVDASTKKATPNATGNTLIGVALDSAATTDTEVFIYVAPIHPTAS